MNPLATVLTTATVLCLGAAPALAADPTSSGFDLAITSPVSYARHLSTPVTCATAAGVRTVKAKATRNGVTAAFTIAVSKYTGPATYPSSTMTLTVTSASGTKVLPKQITKVPVIVTETGGTFAAAGTSKRGKPVAVALSWTCSA